MAEKKRIVWIDQFKGVAFIFVILGHLSINGVFKSWIYSFHMPLFFFATGMTMNVEKIYKTSFKDYFLVHAKRMLLPYLWMQMLSFCLRQVAVMIRARGGEVPVIGYLKGMLYGNSNTIGAPSNPLYYVLLLFVVEIVIWFLVKLCRANKTALAVFSVLLLPLSLMFERTPLVWHINCVPVGLFFIVVGMFMMSLYKAKREALEKLNIFAYAAMTLALFAVGFVVWRYNGRFSLHGNYYGEDFTLATIAAVVTSTAIALCVMKLPEKEKLLNFIGQNTLFYMGIHKPLILIFESMFPDKTKEPLFLACATVACVFVLVPVTVAARKLIPFAAGLFTSQPTKAQKAGQFAAVFAACIVPYNYFLNHFNEGLLKSTTLYTALSFAVYAVAVLLVWLVSSRFMPWIYLCEGKKKA